MSILHTFQRHRIGITTTLVLMSCILLSLLFPARTPLESLSGAVLFFFLIPALYVRFILRKPLAQWGFTVGDPRWWKQHLLIFLGTMVACTLLFTILGMTTTFIDTYARFLPLEIFASFWKFLLYQFTTIAIIVTLVEIFYRGFIMHALMRSMGAWAMLGQWVIGALILFLFLGTAVFFAVPLLLIGAFSGIVAYYTRSLLWAILFTFLFLLFFNTFVIAQ